MFKTKKIIKIFLTLYLFMAIYAPPFTSINTLYFLTLYSLLSIIHQHRYRLSSVLKRSEILTFLAIVALMLFMQLVSNLRSNIMGVNHPEILSIYLLYQSVVLMVSMFICITYILCTLEKYDISNNELLKSLLFAGLIQASLAFLAYFVPSIRYMFLDIIGKNANLSSLYTNYSGYLMYRGYGFSINLLDAFGFGTGLLGGISVILGTENKKYYIVAVLLTLTTLLNSRTGLIVIALSILICFLNGKTTALSIKKILRFSGTLAIVVFVYFMIVPRVLLYIFNSTQSHIIKSTARDLLKVVNLDYHTLRPEMWILPDSAITYIFGDGIAVNTIYTTVGFVNVIWAFGLLGTFIVYFMVTYIFVKAIRLNKSDPISYMISIMMLLVFYIIQLKMLVFTYNAGTFIMYFYVVNSIYAQRKYKSLYSDHSNT